MHGGWMHLIGNMLFLWIFGNNIEDYFGPIKFIIFYLVSGLAAITLFTLFGPDSQIPLVGASGAIFTLAAAAMLIKPLKSSLFFLFMPLGLVAILYFLYNILAVILELGGNVGYVAHVTGFLIGVPYGITFSEGKWVKNLAITALLLATFLATVWLIQNLSSLI